MKTHWQLPDRKKDKDMIVACVYWDDQSDTQRVGIGEGPEPMLWFTSDEALWIIERLMETFPGRRWA